MSSATSVPSSRRSTPSSPALKLFVVLARAMNAVRGHVEEDVSKLGLTETEWGILEVLYQKGPLLLGDVQRRILVSSGGITYLVDRLASRGLVERRECTTDRRARYAALTPEGEKFVKAALPGHLTRIEEVMSGLTQAEQKECTRLLRKLGLHAGGVVE